MKNNHIILCNLKKAHNHILVHPTKQDLLIIKYQNRLYKYQGMPFVLNEAVRVFTEIMKKAIYLNYQRYALG
jgi:hypothetical protein